MNFKFQFKFKFKDDSNLNLRAWKGVRQKEVIPIPTSRFPPAPQSFRLKYMFLRGFKLKFKIRIGIGFNNLNLKMQDNNFNRIQI